MKVYQGCSIKVALFLVNLKSVQFLQEISYCWIQLMWKKTPMNYPRSSLVLNWHPWSKLSPLFFHSSLESCWNTGLATRGLCFILLGSLEPTDHVPCHRRWLLWALAFNTQLSLRCFWTQELSVPAAQPRDDFLESTISSCGIFSRCPSKDLWKWYF